jgi:hypothetical protein
LPQGHECALIASRVLTGIGVRVLDFEPASAAESILLSKRMVSGFSASVKRASASGRKR